MQEITIVWATMVVACSHSDLEPYKNLLQSEVKRPAAAAEGKRLRGGKLVQ